jgi:hypothetical protein
MLPAYSWQEEQRGSPARRRSPHYLRSTTASLACRAPPSPLGSGLKAAYGSKLTVFRVPDPVCASSALGPDPYGTRTTYTRVGVEKRAPVLWKALGHPSERPAMCVNEARPRSWLAATETFAAFGCSLGQPPVIHAQGVGMNGGGGGGGGDGGGDGDGGGSGGGGGGGGGRGVRAGGALGLGGVGAAGGAQGLLGDQGPARNALSNRDRNAIARMARGSPGSASGGGGGGGAGGAGGSFVTQSAGVTQAQTILPQQQMR